ncbi:putative sugar phosphate isomerase RC0402 [uncultured Gammaproteobacteria bacterium]
MTLPTIALAADHGGYGLKAQIKQFLAEGGYGVLDFGTNGPDAVDYPDYAQAVAEAIRDHTATLGILVCGTGIGMSMVANRAPWVRAAVVTEVTSARLARLHNDANVLALGSRIIGWEVARECVTAFLTTPFEGSDRHQRRIAKFTSHPTGTP